MNLTYDPNRPKRRYNWRRDLPDKRDWLYDRIAVQKDGQVLPQSADLRQYCPPVVDQGQIGSCTANALAGDFSFVNGIQMAMSRLFIYWNERVMEGDPYQDGGAEIRDGVLSLKNIGVCSEVTWPYQPGLLFQQPPQSAFAEAAGHKALNAFRLDNTNLESMKACLANGYPFVMGFAVYSSFESDQVASTGIMPMPSFQYEQMLGGHAVLAVGYDESKQMFLIRNSWGASWGIGGYFWMPYAYIIDPALCSDFWTLRK